MSKFVLFPLFLLAYLAATAMASPLPAHDRDRDGLPDRWERQHRISTSSASGRLDLDHDGLNNLSEYRRRLNPRRADTDHDGLNDGREVRRYRTNPRKADSDGDGYRDGVEVRAHSNPRKRLSVPAGSPPRPRPAPGLPAPAPSPRAASPASTPPVPGGNAPGGSGTPAPPGPTGTPVPTPPPTPVTCDRNASPGGLAAAFSAATAGQTVCLAAGDYGTFSGGQKGADVFVRPQAGAAASLKVSFTAAAHIVLDGLTVKGSDMSGSTHDITIRNSAFTEAATFDGLANANILFDHNTHANINAGGQFDAPARIHLSYGGTTPSGITIENSLLSGGDADGIQSGVGLNILNNEFRDILEAGGTNHTDAIQLLDAPGTVVRGNWIHNSATGIVAYDGLIGATIEDNVVELPGRPWGIEVYSDKGSTVRHNTLRYGANCDYNLPCGAITLDRKSADPAGQGTVVVDNIATEISLNNGSAAATRNHNLVRRSLKAGDVLGTPLYSGGSAPGSFAAFRLAAGSPGKAAASDGADIGIR